MDESARHTLFARLEEVLGRREASILMENLPLGGWVDVARIRDLEVLEHKLTAVFLDRINGLTRMMMLGFLTTFIGLGGLIFAAAKLG